MPDKRPPSAGITARELISVSRERAQAMMHEAGPVAIDDAIGSTQSRKMLYVASGPSQNTSGTIRIRGRG